MKKKSTFQQKISTKLVYSLLYTTFLISYAVKANAQCNCTNCTQTINTSSNTNIVALAGDVICIGPNAVITGTVTVNQGGKVCNSGVIYGDITLDYQSTLCNDGKIEVKNLNIGTHAHFFNYGTTIVENFVAPLKSGEIQSFGCIYFKNGFTAQQGANTYFNGPTTIDGDLKIAGGVNVYSNRYLEINGRIIVKDAATLNISAGTCAKANGVDLYSVGTIKGTGPGYGQLVVSGTTTNSGAGKYEGTLDVCLSTAQGSKPNATTIESSVTFCTNNMNCAPQTCENDSNCTSPPTTGLPKTFINCSTRKIDFTNTSTGTTKFYWDFGDTTTVADTSNLANPFYTYPSYGTFLVTLIAYSENNPLCNDTLLNFPVTIDSCKDCNMTLSSTKTDAICGFVGGCNAIPIPLSSWTNKTIPASDNCSGQGTFAYFSNSTDIIGTSPSKSYYICGGNTIGVTSAEYSQNKFITTTSPCLGKAGAFFQAKGSPQYMYLCPCELDSTSGYGNATVTVVEGVAPYTYRWSPLGGSDSIANNLKNGVYTVNVIDATGCQKSTTVIIDAKSDITLATSQTPITSCGAKDATATVTPSGGKGGTYNYSWMTNPVQTDSTAIGLPPGLVTVIVTDSAGCSKSHVFTIAQSLQLNVVTSKTDIRCKGANNGTVTADRPTTGTEPYQYLWNTTPAVTDTFVSGLEPGFYIVTVTDANGCTGTAASSVADSSMQLSVTTTKINCNGGSDGTATVIAKHGTQGYTYSWSTIPSQTTSTAIGLSHTNYIAKVTDATGCADSIAVIVDQPDLSISLYVNDISTVNCSGIADGAATVLPIGGTAPYTYSWCSGTQNDTVSGLPEGKCFITVTDSIGCSNTDSIDIVHPLPLIAANIDGSVSCNGANTGVASVNVSGGYPAYTFAWNTTPVQTSPSLTNLGAGTYDVTVTDTKGCTSTTTVSITEPATLDLIKGTVTKAGCNLTNGTASVLVAGGTANYTFSWNSSPVQTDSLATNLAPGDYIAQVVDANGCSDTVNVSILGSTLNAKADFTVGYEFSCVDGGLMATFTNTGLEGTGWLWKFENGTTSTNATPPVQRYGFGVTSPIVLIAIDEGCADTLKADINTKPFDDYIRIPNVFTPNGDNKNDCFEVSAIENVIPCLELEVYDRWGLKMYGNENGTCWDGKRNGKDVPEGTYYYILRIKNVNDSEFKKAGFLQLLR